MVLKLRDRPQRTLLGQHRANEFVPFRHAGPFFAHVVPAVVILRTHILQRVVLDTVSNFLGDTCLAGEGLPCATQIAIGHDRNDPTVSLAPHEAVERAMADRPLRVLCRREEPPVLVRLN